MGRCATARQSARGRLGGTTEVAAIAADGHGASGFLANEPLYFNDESFSVQEIELGIPTATSVFLGANYSAARISF